MTMPDVVVIGGGIVGAACARALALAGQRVTLIEPGPLDGSATGASAGMLAPLVEASEDDPLLSLAVRGRDRTVELVPDLEDETGLEIGLWTKGILHLAASEQEAADERHKVAWQRQQGFTAEWLEPDEVAARAPGVTRAIVGASLASEDGALDPIALRTAVLASAANHGVSIRSRERAVRLVTRAGRVQVVLTDRRPTRGVRCGGVVLAAGCWSGGLEGVPHQVPVAPVRGQMVAHRWPEAEPPGIVYGCGVYVLARAAEALAGSTMEHVGFDTSVTHDKIEAIRIAAERVFPRLAESEVTRAWAGLRPVTPDGRPLIGADPEVEGLWYATGHGRNGILLGLLTGDLIATIVTEASSELDLKLLDPTRFRTA